MNVWHRLSTWLLLGAAALFAIGGGRFLYVAWQELPPMTDPAPRVTLTPRNDVGDLGRNLHLDPGGLMVNSLLQDNNEPPRSSEVLALIFVLTEGPRRDVLLNGTLVGQSPYMGQTQCERGSQLDIALKASDGTEKHFKRSCSSEIRVAD